MRNNKSIRAALTKRAMRTVSEARRCLSLSLRLAIKSALPAASRARLKILHDCNFSFGVVLFHISANLELRIYSNTVRMSASLSRIEI